MLDGGREAREVEIDAANEVEVGADFRRRGFHAFPFFGHQVIDRVKLGRVNPHETIAVAHRGDGGGGVSAFVANQDGGFATADHFNEGGIAFHHFRNLTITTGENRFGGDVARFAPGVGRNHSHLLHRSDILHDRIERENVDFDRLDLLLLKLGTVGDPGA